MPKENPCLFSTSTWEQLSLNAGGFHFPQASAAARCSRQRRPFVHGRFPQTRPSLFASLPTCTKSPTWFFCFAHLRPEPLTLRIWGSHLAFSLDRPVVPTLGFLGAEGREHYLENYFSLSLPTDLDRHWHLSGLKFVLLQMKDGSRPAY